MSINAEEPERVAVFLSSLMAGRAMPFPPFADSWIAFSWQDDGSAIEVYPLTHRLHAGAENIECRVGEPTGSPTFVHIAISSPLERGQILALAGAEGWLARTCDRGPFECIEVWLENRLLVEVLDPQMQSDYRRGMSMQNWSDMVGLE